MTQPHKLYFLHAVTPLHVGVEDTLGGVDLPTMKERHTGYPLVPGSSVKGVLRAELEPPPDANRKGFLAAFGPESTWSNLVWAACEEVIRSGWLTPAQSANAATAVPPAGMLNGPVAISMPMSRELSAVWANPDFIQSAFVVLVKLSAPAPEQVRARKLRAGPFRTRTPIRFGVDGSETMPSRLAAS